MAGAALGRVTPDRLVVGAGRSPLVGGAPPHSAAPLRAGRPAAGALARAEEVSGGAAGRARPRRRPVRPS